MENPSRQCSPLGARGESILITGARAPIALELARSFHQHGYRVVMADSFKLTIARWSNAVSKYYVLPSPRYEGIAFKKALQEIIATENITHLIPTCEEAFFISHIKEDLNCKIWCADPETMHRLHNKWTFSQEWKTILNVPETKLLAGSSDVAGSSVRLDGAGSSVRLDGAGSSVRLDPYFNDWQNTTEYVFKPIYSRFATATIVGKKISENHVNHEDKKHWIAQRLIKGKEICVYSIWDNGQLKACVLYHPLYRAGKGSGIFFEPITHDTITTLVTQVGTQLNYTGQLCFDVIEDNAGVPHFIECNPRGTSGAHLLNNDLCPAFLSEYLSTSAIQTEYSIKYAILLLKPFAIFNTRVKKSRDVIYKSGDIKPLLLQALSLLEITWRKIKRRSTWLEATTSDIEWNGYDR